MAILKKFKAVVLIVGIIIIGIVTWAILANSSMKNPPLDTTDLANMTMGAEFPYLSFSNDSYCIINMWQGGVVVYDFSQKQIVDRVSFETLSKLGFRFPMPLISDDGATIYFAEDNMRSNQEIAYSYDMENRRLKKVSGEADYSIFINDFVPTESQLPDGYIYGSTCIENDGKVTISRAKEGNFRFGDIEIIVSDTGTADVVYPLI